MYQKIPTTHRPTASDIAAFLLACFPFATLMAMVWYGDWIFPVVAKLFGG